MYSKVPQKIKGHYYGKYLKKKKKKHDFTMVPCSKIMAIPSLLKNLVDICSSSPVKLTNGSVLSVFGAN